MSGPKPDALPLGYAPLDALSKKDELLERSPLNISISQPFHRVKLKPFSNVPSRRVYGEAR